MALQGFQKKYLRGKAHNLKPIVQLGKSGMTPHVMNEIDLGLRSHELIKVRLVGDKTEKKRIILRVERALNAEAVGLIGHVAIFYRQHPEPEERRIKLPRR